MGAYAELPATSLASLIRARALSPAELVDFTIDFIERVNPTLNALVADRFDDARREARAATARLMRSTPDELPPLFGVPCTIKECYALSGMPWTAGSVYRRDTRATEDATVVARVRAAGAIPLGVTNVPEMAMWMETHNKVFGRTRNPYDPTRIVGGSSGGEAAIIGSGASPFGLGSDVGGSIRMPSFFCGIFGHKPTGGIVPGTGHMPSPSAAAARFNTYGPMARSAADLMPILRLMAGADGRDASVREHRLRDPEQVRVDELTVFSIAGNGRIAVSADLRHAQRSAAEALAARGAHVVHVELDELRRSFAIWSDSLKRTADRSFREWLGDGQSIPLGREILRAFVGRSRHTVPALGLAVLEELGGRLPFVVGGGFELGQALQRQVEEMLGPRGVLLYPSYSRPAPRHNRPLLTPFDWIYTAVWNMLEMPSTQVPLGLNHDGLPLGVQVVGARDNDHLTIAVAQALEEDFGGWVPPRTVARRARVEASQQESRT